MKSCFLALHEWSRVGRRQIDLGTCVLEYCYKNKSADLPFKLRACDLRVRSGPKVAVLSMELALNNRCSIAN